MNSIQIPTHISNKKNLSIKKELILTYININKNKSGDMQILKYEEEK
jgi:hypothetical protein